MNSSSITYFSCRWRAASDLGRRVRGDPLSWPAIPPHTRVAWHLAGAADPRADFRPAHLLNPNATLVAGLAIALEAGVMLAAAYLLTSRLWLSMGIHFAWNFTPGGIFGAAGSGQSASASTHASTVA
jgi:CAAX prenyl protease-like protein